MGISDEVCAVSGVWSGRFHHDQDDHESVAFSAWLTISQNRLSGSTLEPNTLTHGNDEELDALLRGHVQDREIVLLKTYRGIDQEPIYCEGELTEDGRRIVGQWYFGWPNEITGTFEMSREIANASAAARRSAIADS